MEFVHLVDKGLDLIHSQFIRKFYRAKNFDYGIHEAIFYPRGIDTWSRYISVLREVLKINSFDKKSVLDVGSGGGEILAFLGSQMHDIFLLDIRKECFKHISAQAIVGEGSTLPFKDNSFDTIVAVSIIEHVPQEFRAKLFMEFERVCKRKLIIHCPVESNDMVYCGRTYDLKFQRAHHDIFGTEDISTAEHIDSKHPTLDELKRFFPNAKIFGRKNCDVWFRYMMLERKPVLRFFTGVIYWLLWKNKDNKPPYYECMLVLEK